jgi:hypothetical protein
MSVGNPAMHKHFEENFSFQEEELYLWFVLQTSLRLIYWLTANFIKMENEKSLTPEESLELISGTIARTRENLQENSFGFLLWGWLIAIASFAFFLLHQYTSTPYYFLPFPVLAVTGIILTILYFRRKYFGPTLGYTTYFLIRMWIVLGVSFIMVVFINVSQGKMPFTYTLLVAGIGTLVSGLVMKFSPMVTGGILLLGSSLISIYIPDDYKPLLHGIAITAGYLVPGYLLKKSKS